MLVVGGFNHGDSFTDVEVVDLGNSKTTCSKPSNFPTAVHGSIGGLDMDEKPVVCGGKANGNFTNACFKYVVGEWQKIDSMNKTRHLAASIQLDQPYSGLLVLGGRDQIVSHPTSEILTKYGWENGLHDFPPSIYFHCMVQLNSTHLMVIAGLQNGLTSTSNTFIINLDKKIWTEGPPLISGRQSHMCARIHHDSLSTDVSIIVVGGWNPIELDTPTTEILDQGANEWRQGPELPYGISVSNLVEDSSGGVVLIGGQTSFERRYDVTADIFRLPNAGADAR